MQTPKYAETIIVGVNFNNVFNWYVSDKEIWYLDLRKLIQAFKSKGFNVPNPEDFSERFNIDIVDENNAEQFLSHMCAYITKTEELSKLIRTIEREQISDFIPSIYIDFDNKRLISNYPEPASYEVFIPNNWSGEYKSFNELIPENQRYWMFENKNWLEEL